MRSAQVDLARALQVRSTASKVRPMEGSLALRHDSRELEEAIFAAPSDPHPRLVYADWLQSRGDPRGDLAVIQHALESAHGREWARLKCEELELFERFGEEWFGPLNRWPQERQISLDWWLGAVDGLRGDNFGHDAVQEFLQGPTVAVFGALTGAGRAVFPVRSARSVVE